MIDRIVVGIDGSAHADRALAFALSEAIVHGASVTVVFGYVHPQSLAFGAHPGPSSWTWLDKGHLRAAVQRELDQAIARADPPSDVEVTSMPVEAPPAEALLRTAIDLDADLLVVGSRGRGGFRGLLLGSTGQHVVSHSPCPVVVVPADGEGADGRRG